LLPIEVSCVMTVVVGANEECFVVHIADNIAWIVFHAKCNGLESSNLFSKFYNGFRELEYVQRLNSSASFTLQTDITSLLPWLFIPTQIIYTL
jgi:hypothetical protein